MALTEADLATYLAKPYYQAHPDIARAMLAHGEAHSVGESRSPEVPEGALLAHVRRTALAHGWLFYHTYSSRKSDPGFPDCAMVKPQHPLYLWELKTATGKLTQAQTLWLQFVQQCTGVETGCYRPTDLSLLLAKLQAP